MMILNQNRNELVKLGMKIDIIEQENKFIVVNRINNKGDADHLGEYNDYYAALDVLEIMTRCIRGKQDIFKMPRKQSNYYIHIQFNDIETAKDEEGRICNIIKEHIGLYSVMLYGADENSFYELNDIYTVNESGVNKLQEIFGEKNVRVFK